MALMRHLTSHLGILYAGRLVERGPTDEIFANPRHPYTRALLAAIPRAAPDRRREHAPIAGESPNPFVDSPGCRFAPRCPLAEAHCLNASPELEGAGGNECGRDKHEAACFRSHALAPFEPESDSVRLMSPAFRRRMNLLRRARLDPRSD